MDGFASEHHDAQPTGHSQAEDGSLTVSDAMGIDATGTNAATVNSADDAIVLTRSEERLGVHRETYAVERVRLEKYIVEEERTVTVTVRREEMRLVREPIDAVRIDTGNQPTGNQPHTDDEFTMVLSEEQVVVTKRIVPVERVRLIRHAVTEQRVVTESVDKERIELDDDVRRSDQPV